MRITKLKIKDLIGIQEFEADGRSIELRGENGTGKTSVVDAIRYALTNKYGRKDMVRKGANKGEILIELDNGVRIDRKPRKLQADYKSVKRNGEEVGSPEAFLRDLFTPLQLNPVEFMGLPENKQNAQILDLIEYEWGLDKIKEWFGEIPDWVSYDQNILSVLDYIQSEKGEYFQRRQDLNREIRNKRAFIEEIGGSLPKGYRAEDWEKENLSGIYAEIEGIRKENETIEKARQMVENRDNKARKFEADREIAKAVLDKEMNAAARRLDNEITGLEERLQNLKKERAALSEKKADKLAVIEEKYRADVAEFDAVLKKYQEYAKKETMDLSPLLDKARQVEEMKLYVNEYYRMADLEMDVENLSAQSEDLTRKIELARTLPGTILDEAEIPIDGLTVEDGTPLINGLPVSNLSDGEKLDLCVDVAIQKPNGLQIILLDGVEKLSTGLKERVYDKCRKKGLQFIATKTTDDECLTVVEF